MPGLCPEEGKTRRVWVLGMGDRERVFGYEYRVFENTFAGYNNSGNGYDADSSSFSPPGLRAGVRFIFQNSFPLLNLPGGSGFP